MGEEAAGQMHVQTQLASGGQLGTKELRTPREQLQGQIVSKPSSEQFRILPDLLDKRSLQT